MPIRLLPPQMTVIPRLLRKSRDLRNPEASTSHHTYRLTYGNNEFQLFLFIYLPRRLIQTSSEFAQRRNPMTKSLTGKVALVTGGSRGIGAASARALADEGANVAISYVASADKAEAVVKELKVKGVEARAFKADQASTVEVDRLVKDVA